MYERLLKIAEGKRYNFSVKRYRSGCGANFRVGEKSGRGGGEVERDGSRERYIGKRYSVTLQILRSTDSCVVGNLK